MRGPLRIGTRGSRLALIQAEEVRKKLITQNPHLEIEIAVIKTKGDKILDRPLFKIGGEGLFIREIEEALLKGDIHLAVHSLKDLSSNFPENLILGGVLPRADPRDVYVGRNNIPLSTLPRGSQIGTSSLRRRAQLLALHPHLGVLEIRGNIETRIHKMDTQGCQGIIVAGAGLLRMGLEHRITSYFSPEEMVPAAGQGMIALEIHKDFKEGKELLEGIIDSESLIYAQTERAFLRELGGGCLVPAGCCSFIRGKGEGRRMTITGLIADPSGVTVLKESRICPVPNSRETAKKLAEELLLAGGKEILNSLERISGGKR